MRSAPLRVLVEDDGAALVEYGIILAALVMTAMGALQLMGLSLNTLLRNTTASWSSASNSGS